jgi:leader peptidase (prepilin peptidase)/N-methyltransferase
MFEPLAVFIFGLIIGSFCNVVIYRLPVGESLIAPGSHCRACKTPIRPWDNIPVLSYLFLRGRCRACGTPFSPRYPCVEFISGVLYTLLWHQFGFNVLFMIYALLSLTLLVITFIDFDHKIIPNVITLPGMVIGLTLSFLVLPITPIDSFIGLLGGGFFFYIIALLSRDGMGGGDIKLIAMIGAFLGLQGVLFTILIGALSGSLIGLSLIISGKKIMKDKVPFGPFLAFGSILYILFGDQIIAWYFQRIF